MTRKTKQEFIEVVQLVHGDKLNYAEENMSIHIR